VVPGYGVVHHGFVAHEGVHLAIRQGSEGLGLVVVEPEVGF